MRTRGLKRSVSKDDTSSSIRDSGISISEEFSGSEQANSNGFEKKKKKKEIRRVKNYQCNVCEKSFQGRVDLRRHLLIHADVKPHVCHICQKAYRQEYSMRLHIKVAHTKQRDFVCCFCHKPFPVKDRLKTHMRLHTGEKPYVCPHCPKTFARGGQLQQHLTTHDDKLKQSCLVRPSTFSSERNLKLHMERHKEEQGHTCKTCKNVFTTVIDLEEHIKSDHPTEQKFKCPICENIVTGELETHMKTHRIAKTHECEICKAVFAQRTQYKVHKRKHTGERPFQCRICWQNFAHTSVLKLHIRKHTGEKPFKCLLCKHSDTAFSQLSHLKTHMKSIHKKDNAYACPGCKECFKVKFCLEDHMKSCEQISPETKFEPIKDDEANRNAALLSRLRYLYAVLLKKISTQEKLQKLGFEKRLIDNVLIASLKLANRNCYDSNDMSELDRMKLNIQEFLMWIVPAEIMDAFKKECPSIESILDKIVTMYLKQVE